MVNLIRRKKFGIQACTQCKAAIDRNSRFKSIDGLDLCVDCWRNEVEVLLRDLEPEAILTLRRRVVDHIRKSDICMMRVAADLASRDLIKISDLI